MEENFGSSSDPFSYFTSRSHSEPHLIRAQAVLAAIRDVIAPENNAVAYFGAIMTTLQQQVAEPETQSLDALAALCYLLSIVMKFIPNNVIQNKQEPISSVLFGLLKSEHAESALIVKPVLSCVFFVLNTFDSPTSNALPLFQALLEFGTDTRPKVRKESQANAMKYVQSLISASFLTGNSFPLTLSNLIVNFTNRVLNQDNLIALHHVGGFVTSAISVVPESTSKSLMNSIMDALVRFKNEMFYVVAMKCWENYAVKLNGADPISQRVLEYRPNTSEMSANSFLNVVMHLSPTNLGFDCILQLLLSPHVAIANKAVVTASNMLHRIETDNVPESEILLIIKTSQKLLLGLYKPVWALSFKVLKSLFEVAAKRSLFAYFEETVRLLGSIHDSDQLQATPILISKLDDLFSLLLERFGPENIFTVLPLDLPVDDESLNRLARSRSWMLPLLKTISSSLEYFFTHLHPCAQNLFALVHSQNSSQAPVQKSVLTGLLESVWAAFPSFCNTPTDLVTGFKKIAKTLGNYLKDESQSHTWIPICKGLALLALSCTSVSVTPQSLDDEEEPATVLTTHNRYPDAVLEQNRNALSGFSKNFLPLLFGLVGKVPLKDREIVLNSIERLSAISDNSLVNDSFGTVLTKFGENLSTSERTIMIDIAIALCKFLNVSNAQKLLVAVAQMLTHEDALIQKRGYKIMFLICKSSAFAGNEILEQLFTLWTSNMANCHTTSKKNRLAVLTSLLSLVPVPAPSFVAEIFPALLVEVMLSVKELSDKTRAQAYSVVNDMAKYFRTHDSLENFIMMVIAGVAGNSPHMQSGAVLVLSKLITEFHEDMSETFFMQTSATLFTLLKSQSQELVKSVVGFCKLFMALKHEVPQEMLFELISGLMVWRDAHTRFKAKIKTLLEIACRRYGREKVQACVPLDATSWFSVFLKQIDKQKKDKKDKDKKGGDSKKSEAADDDMESDDDSTNKKQPKLNFKRVWIEDDQEVDMLDPSFSRHLLTRKPKRTVTEVDDFKTDEFGRMILEEDSDTDNQKENDDSDDSEKEDAGNSKETKLKKPNNSDGSIYKATKAKGDRKVKGKPDPYAFVPLDPKLLNRRNKHQAKHQFDNVVNAAHKGAAKGAKMNKKFRKNK